MVMDQRAAHGHSSTESTPGDPTEVEELLDVIGERVLWLAVRMVDAANRERHVADAHVIDVTSLDRLYVAWLRTQRQGIRTATPAVHARRPTDSNGGSGAARHHSRRRIGRDGVDGISHRRPGGQPRCRHLRPVRHRERPVRTAPADLRRHRQRRTCRAVTDLRRTTQSRTMRERSGRQSPAIRRHHPHVAPSGDRCGGRLRHGHRRPDALATHTLRPSARDLRS